MKTLVMTSMIVSMSFCGVGRVHLLRRDSMSVRG